LCLPTFRNPLSGLSSKTGCGIFILGGYPFAVNNNNNYYYY
jgi:hypothetical protein